MITVILVEDQTIVREGLENLLLLTEDIRVIARADNGVSALLKIQESKPDIVLLDVRMPQMSGLDVLRSLSLKKDAPPVIVLTTFDDDDVILEAFRLGASGFLMKDISLERLTDAIRRVVKGEKLFAATITERLLRTFQAGSAKPKSQSEQDRLTEREVEVLHLLTNGFSNGEIAFALRVAEGTIKNHVSNILGKLGVRDRTRAVLKAIESGYLTP